MNNKKGKQWVEDIVENLFEEAEREEKEAENFFLVPMLGLGTPLSHGLCPNLPRLSLKVIRFQAEPGNEIKDRLSLETR